MWLVLDDEEGLIGIYNDKKEAEEVYQEYVSDVLNYVQDEGEFTGCERVILARLTKQSFVFDTKNL